MIIEIPQKYIDIAKKFAEDSVNTNTSMYAKRNQYNKDAIIRQIEVGKLGEYGVYLALSKFCKVTEPDIKVYNKYNKSFDSDLHVNDIALHVKTQDSIMAERYGLSWMFQAEDPVIHTNELVALTELNKYTINIHYIIEINKLKFEDPVKDSLKGIKKVIYYNTLRKMNGKV